MHKEVLKVLLADPDRIPGQIIFYVALIALCSSGREVPDLAVKQKIIKDLRFRKAPPSCTNIT